MLALIYFALAACVGDFLCRRFYQFESAAHRCAAAILVGLLVSSWFTYLAGLAFFWTPQPLLWANLLFFVAAVALLSWPKWKGRILKSTSVEAYPKRSNLYLTRPEGSSIAEWLLIAGYVVLVSWMMFASFNAKEGKLLIANPEYSDFGPNTALIQSFAVGHNFPTEYPHFSGDRIRYHFLFYFQAGNLEFLGFNPAWSLNLTQHNHNRGDARDRHDAWGRCFSIRAQSDALDRCSFSFSGRSLTSRFFKSKLQFARLFKRSHINGTIFRRSFRIAVKPGVRGLR